MIDIERIKTEIPIESLIAQSFTVTGSGHTLTTEEHDSLKIFTRNNSWAWYSQEGRNGKALGGSVIDWYMHMHQCSRGGAIRALGAMLEGGAMPVMPRPEPAPIARPTAEAWRAADWQSRARQRLEAGQDTLWNQPAGQAGRDYLTARGLRLDVAIAFGLGFANVWNRKAGRKLPALLIPWQNRQITAVQYRFIGVAKGDDTADRFGQLKGGDRILFGLQNCFDLPDWKPHTLIIVEGELNAVAIAQPIRDMGLPVDVVSFGPQVNIGNQTTVNTLAKITLRYRHVIVWADEPEAARAALGNLPDHTQPIRSPYDMDANDLLKSGQLDDFLWGWIQRISNQS